MLAQMSASSSLHLETRVTNLEQGHESLRKEVDALTEMCHRLSSVDHLKKGEHSVSDSRFQDEDIKESHQEALRFRHELEELSREAMEPDTKKSNDMENLKANSVVPLHLATVDVGDACFNSSSPHEPSKNTDGTQQRSMTAPNSHIIIDGPVDNRVAAPAPVPTPPLSPVTVAQQVMQPTPWKPHFLTSLRPLSTIAELPSAAQMVSFHPEFLKEQLGGIDWSPGLWFIPGKSTCILKNRSYYLLDPATEPYLPEKPGQHGAKLTAFFNKSPEEVFDDLPGDVNTSENVPLFVEHGGRYFYYGNYSQTRWSDKLDYDTMVTRVPPHVRAFWAAELTSTIRQEWVTEELKKHFFQKPEYEGCIYAALAADNTSINSIDEVKLNEKMARDVRKYIAELCEWEREAKMKTAMLKKQSILDAFDAADADDPPALRLWWEYLQCVDWRKDFYDLLVTLQSRETGRYLR
ncbi:hypothetical protein GQ44DRAFT_607780 [Phaeosphaeriaceae sp. PMI808]|nr:hypothetical protein GQ44DRAFT_607780 [Phaeosphaeriaceae sp. PMI808]